MHIDHIYQLALAWDMGAARWPKQRRVDFANDQAANLLAVDGPANASKNDDGPGEWMPMNRGYPCTYVLRYLQVARSPHRSRDRGRSGCQGVNGPRLFSRSVRSVCVCVLVEASSVSSAGGLLLWSAFI
ncbi:HNH endonuclease family protein [Kribbella sp. NBC_01510]|uniref:HNH endonuclease family protein n=1 Tax=Kribbella sp. NBC_01510 TaxID=2903581 RepID=UPI003864F2D5